MSLAKDGREKGTMSEEQARMTKQEMDERSERTECIEIDERSEHGRMSVSEDENWI